jgi:hypothetical protein
MMLISAQFRPRYCYSFIEILLSSHLNQGTVDEGVEGAASRITEYWQDPVRKCSIHADKICAYRGKQHFDMGFPSRLAQFASALVCKMMLLLDEAYSHVEGTWKGDTGSFTSSHWCSMVYRRQETENSTCFPWRRFRFFAIRRRITHTNIYSPCKISPIESQG